MSLDGGIGSPRILARRLLRSHLEWWGGYFRRCTQSGIDFFSDSDNEFNPVLGSEALLSVLLPLVDTKTFNASMLRSPDPGVTSVLSSLKLATSAKDGHGVIGSSLSTADFDGLFSVLQNFFERSKGNLSGGTYFTLDGDNPELTSLPVIDAMSAGLSVSLATIKLITRLSKDSPPAAKYMERWDGLRREAMERLRVSMFALHDSFVVSDIESADWDRAVNKRYPFERSAFLSVVQKLRDLDIPISVASFDAEFEIGWSWGVLAPPSRVPRPEGLTDVFTFADQHLYADSDVYLYFTSMALDGLADLWAEEVQAGGFLGAEELLIANRLRAMWAVTIEYWTILARQRCEDTGLTRLQDLPWQTTDKDESEYYSLYLLNILIRQGSAMSPEEIDQYVMLAKELSERGRITRRPPQGDSEAGIDPGLLLHSPGKILTLGIADEMGKTTKGIENPRWAAYDFAPTLLKAVAQLTNAALSLQTFRMSTDLLTQILIHIDQRRLTTGLDGRGDPAAWDNLVSVFPILSFKASSQATFLPAFDGGLRSWYFTERVVEALSILSGRTGAAAPPSPLLVQLTTEIVNFSEWMAVEESDEESRSVSESHDFSSLRSKAVSDPIFVLGQLLPRYGGRGN